MLGIGSKVGHQRIISDIKKGKPNTADEKEAAACQEKEIPGRPQSLLFCAGEQEPK